MDPATITAECSFCGGVTKRENPERCFFCGTPFQARPTYEELANLLASKQGEVDGLRAKVQERFVEVFDLKETILRMHNVEAELRQRVAALEEDILQHKVGYTMLAAMSLQASWVTESANAGLPIIAELRCTLPGDDEPTEVCSNIAAFFNDAYQEFKNDDTGDDLTFTVVPCTPVAS